MSALKFFRLASVLLFLMITSSLESAEKPNFSGTWIFNPQTSRLEIKDAPIASTFIIQHREPNFHLKRTHVYPDGKRDTWGIDLITDGKHEVVRKHGQDRDVTRMYWDNDVLVLDERITAPDGQMGTNVVRYSLSSNGRNLIALEHEEFPDGKVTNRWVFDKQFDPREKNSGGR